MIILSYYKINQKLQMHFHSYSYCSSSIFQSLWGFGPSFAINHNKQLAELLEYLPSAICFLLSVWPLQLGYLLLFLPAFFFFNMFQLKQKISWFSSLNILLWDSSTLFPAKVFQISLTSASPTHLFYENIAYCQLMQLSSIRNS